MFAGAHQSPHPLARRAAFLVTTFGLGLALALVLGGCARHISDPALATERYPADRHSLDTIDVQVFRHNDSIELVNATVHSYRDFRLWINQRWMLWIEELPAGGRMHLSLWDFFDELGENFDAGGFWATEPASAVRLVEIQTSDETPMVGLIAID